jgi:hypothetical protein
MLRILEMVFDLAIPSFFTRAQTFDSTLRVDFDIREIAERAPADLGSRPDFARLDSGLVFIGHVEPIAEEIHDLRKIVAEI